MHRMLSLVAIGLVLLPSVSWAAASLAPVTVTSTVLIANYDEEDNFKGWGSGFYVDEGIVVTNRHVIEGGDWYRVYASNEDGTLNLECYKNITRSDVKINLDDDVAYMRAYLPCDHGILRFGQDPSVGDPHWVIGFPYNGTTSLRQTVTTGSVLSTSDEDWYRTSAHLDIGNSGGPVVDGEDVLGVAVAKGVDADGNYVVGFFIPSSVIIRGLLYANDPRFGYTPQDDLPSSSGSASSSSSSISSQSSISSSRTSSRSSSSSSRRSSSSSRRAVSPFRDVSPLRPGYDAILSLHDRNIIGGYPDGTYRPETGINRAEFVKILVAAFRSNAIFGETHCFSDVADEWFASYVCAAKRLGWVEGYPDGTFRPAQQVNRAEGMKIVVEALAKNVKESDTLPSDVRGDTWFKPFVAAGVTLGIVDPDRRFRADQMLTREQAAMWIEGAE